jgi:Hemopexin
MLGAFDTAVFVPRRGLYVFAGDHVWRYSNVGHAPDEGFPRPITAEFPGTFARNLDAALVHPDGSLHLFRGDQHIRYDIGRRRPELGYPRPYAADWPGIFPRRLDAALTWDPDIIYVFSGDHYTSFSPRRGEVRRGFPKAIYGNWPGLDGSPVRAAFSLPGDRRVLITAGGIQFFDRHGNPDAGEVKLPILSDDAWQTRARRTPSHSAELGSLAESTEEHLAAAEESFEPLQGENQLHTQAPTPVDTAAAVPTFKPAERTKIVQPLLAAAARQQAIDWTRHAHPASSGVDVDEIRAALTTYVDVAAVNAALGTGASADDVFVESVHQFQVKCYVDPHEHDGLAGESVLDSLGLIARSGSGMRNADRGSIDAQKRLNCRNSNLKAATGGEFSAANWFDRMADPSVFGQRTKAGAGVHVVLLRKLRAAERHLLTLPAFAGKTPAALGAALGLTEKHSGARPDDKNTSVHSFGLAIDIAPYRNPWVLHNSSWAAVKRAALLVTGTTLTHARASAYFDSLGSDPTRSTGQVWDELRRRNAEVISYFALDKDATALGSALQAGQARGTAGLVNAGESLADAVTRWTASIGNDRKAMAAGDLNGYVSPDRGFLSHPRDLVIALRDHGCLAWGAVDFGDGELASGDMMHFDARIDAAGRVLLAETPAHIPTKGHPCLNATATAKEFEYEEAPDKAKETIRAQGHGRSIDQAAILAALRKLLPSEMAQVSADKEVIDILLDELSGTDLAAAATELARGRVGSMDRTEIGRIVASPDRYGLGTLAAAMGRDVLLAHHEAFDRTGTGTIHGKHLHTPAPAGATSSDCTEYVRDVVARAFAGKNQSDAWTAVLARALKSSGHRGLKGTEVIEALQILQHWEALFWSPDPRNPRDGTAEHPYAYQIVRTKHTYYGIAVDPAKSVVNYRRTDPGAKRDMTGIERLRRLQFGILAARGGTHMAMVLNGAVYEVHWDSPATDRDTVQATPLESFIWQSGVIAAPPRDLSLAWRMP